MSAPAAPPKPLPHSLTKSPFAGWRLLGTVDPFPAGATSLRLEWTADTITGAASGIFLWETLVTLAAPSGGSGGTTSVPYAVPWTYNQQPPGGAVGGVIRFRFVAVNADGETPGPALLWGYTRPFFDPTDPTGRRGVVMRFLDVLPPGAGSSALAADTSGILFTLLNPAPVMDAMVRSNGQLVEVLPKDAAAAPLLYALPVAGTQPRELRLRRATLIARDGASGYGSLFCFSNALIVTPPVANPVAAPGVATVLPATFLGESEGTSASAPGWEIADGQGYFASVREAVSAPDGWTVALARDGATGQARFTLTPPSDRLAFDALTVRRLDTGEGARFSVPEGAVNNAGGWGQIRRFLVTPGGEPDTDPPAAPGELEMVLQGNTFLDLRHKAMPARGRTLRIQRLGGGGWETLPGSVSVGGALVTLQELTPDTLYLLRSLAVNSVGQTPGPEQHVRTLKAAPIGPLNAPGAPVLVSRLPDSATLGQSAWQESQTAMRLYRNGRLVSIFTASGQTFQDVTAHHGDIYELAAVSRFGVSDFSPPFTLDLRSTHTITIQVPVAGKVISGAFDIVFSSDVVLSSPSCKIGGLSKGAKPWGAGYRASGNTVLFVSGPRTITARGLDPDGFEASATVSVVLVNDASSSTKYLTIFDDARTPGMNLGRADVGARTGRIQPSAWRQFWMQARLISSAIEGVSPSWVVDSLTRPQLAELWEKGQPVAMITGETTPVVGADALGLGGVGGSTWRYKSHQAIDRPGTRVYFMIRQTPVQTNFWLDTERDVVVSIKAIDDRNLGVLARNIEPNAPGAALWRFSVEAIRSGTGTDAPVVFSEPIWDVRCDLDAQAPDAFDWALLESKVYVLRESTRDVRVIDLDEGEETLDIALPSVAPAPRFLERVGNKVLVVCVSGIDTVCFDLTFGAPKILWSRSWSAGACCEFAGGLLLARENRVYYSAGATAVPVLLPGAAASDIVTLGRDTVPVGGANGADKLATFARTVGGDFHRITVEEGLTPLSALTLDEEGVAGVGTWIGALEAVHGLTVANPIASGANAAPPRIYEQGTDGAWYPGASLEAPGDHEAPSVVTAVKGFSFPLRAAQGSFGSPGYVPAVYDWKMLVGTGTGGLVAVLERARLSESDGAVRAGALEHIYLEGLESPPSMTSGSGGSGSSSGGSSGSSSGSSPSGV